MKSLSSSVAPSRVAMPMTPFAAAALGAVGADVRALDQAGVRERDDDAFVGDQVFDGDLAFVGHQIRQCAAWRTSL